MTRRPWASGPAEILEHGLGLLTKDDETSRRLAMLLIDNAVEVTIRTYLGLPKRVTGLEIARQRFTDISGSFPKMIDALSEHATDSLGGVDLGELEWLHRLRNELYHNGNGLTIERDKVVLYGQIAKVLWSSLLGGSEDEVRDVPAISRREEVQQSRVQDFLYMWADVQNRLAWAAVRAHGADPHGPWVKGDALETLALRGVVSIELVQEVQELRDLRNAIVHNGEATSITLDDLEKVQLLRARLERLAGRAASAVARRGRVGDHRVTQRRCASRCVPRGIRR